MEGFNSPQGLIAAPITPFRQDGTLDLPGLERLLSRLMKSSQGIFLASPGAGEGIFLNTEQLTALLEAGMNTVMERIPIFMWVTGRTASDTRQTVETLGRLVERKAYGGKVFWVDCPLIYHSNRGLLDNYKDLWTGKHPPIMLYNDPLLVQELTRHFKRKNIRTAILSELAELSGIAGIIFHGTLERVYNYAKATANAKSFSIYEGEEEQFLDRPGLAGLVSAGANLMPEVWGKVTSFCLEISAENTMYPDLLMQIWKMGSALRELVDCYRMDPARVIKQYLSKAGVIEGSYCLSPPKRELTNQIARIEEVLARGDYLP
ncbi:MAG: hypothetical protein COX16_13155 [Deltaproteobacteria bacterium CG23_combo_of_CG06-09_8_20_14_all_51_20]|nr:hypothetical protein [bacterium]OIP43635.1 MAG: hypothetical protein AUK25_00985 [Desulfobacteraceae bacterium CG2_30_51_40]PIP45477.1 MAG: hypothetical protein COX16_13155 [Deltaproteobacteria bacterium CG23_combo_of_CG06-09_8_20_14_all_51_20]PIY23155.1 MAG: hypothetical protein COZ11_10275 [Deltaproteobacteria bacterium CG_4_10_14_3_um_filter_51_14]PJB33936.1 MAG: hypothetical protein CO107_14565 [Deltaproteobacteria bacterium CG_4_9_14_3_um_filter_51_14]